MMFGTRVAFIEDKQWSSLGKLENIVSQEPSSDSKLAGEQAGY